MHASLRRKVIIVTAAAGRMLITLGQSGVAAAAKAPAMSKRLPQVARSGRAAMLTSATGARSMSPAAYPSWAGRF
jgi:hypothetical protein